VCVLKKWAHESKFSSKCPYDFTIGIYVYRRVCVCVRVCFTKSECTPAHSQALVCMTLLLVCVFCMTLLLVCVFCMTLLLVCVCVCKGACAHECVKESESTRANWSV